MRRIKEITYYVKRLPRGSSLLREMYNLYSQNYTGSISETRSLLDLVQTKSSTVSEKVVALWLLNTMPLDAASRAEVSNLYSQIAEQNCHPSALRQQLLTSRKRLLNLYMVLGYTILAAIVAITERPNEEQLLDKYWSLFYSSFLIISIGVGAVVSDRGLVYDLKQYIQHA